MLRISCKLGILAALLIATSAQLLGGSEAAEKTHGLDLAGMDRTVNPGDDFNGYANGGWIKNTAIPADRARFGVFTILEEEVSKRTAGLIQEASKSDAAGSEARKVGDYYNAYMDEQAIERRGIAPLKAELGEIGTLADKTSLARVLGSELRADVDALNNTNLHTDRLLGLWVSPDFDRSGPQRPLPAPGRPRHARPRQLPEQRHEKPRAAGEVSSPHRRCLEVGRVPDADAKAARIYDLEHAIAVVHVSRTESEDVHKANNPWRFGIFPRERRGSTGTSYFQAAGLAGQPVIMVWQPAGVAGIAALVA